MKLEVGMYVRTKYCGICDEIAIRKIIKIDKINNNWFYIDKNVCDIYKDYTNKLNTVNVEKASFNIIDILEVGDVIIDKEGHKYPINYEFETDYNGEYNSYEITIDDYITLFLKDDLSIVTKEQFEQMEYRIGE